MGLVQISGLRKITSLLIFGAVFSIIICYAYMQRYSQKRYWFSADLNNTLSKSFHSSSHNGSSYTTKPWSHHDINYKNDSWISKTFTFTPVMFLPKTFSHSEDIQSLSTINITLVERLVDISEIVKVAGINCSALFNSIAKDKALIPTKSKVVDAPISEQMYINMASDCHKFQTSRGYIMSSLTEEEKDFPLAYSIMVYKDVEMFERLLRAIYRPQNYYCIHVDQKSSDSFYNTILAIVKCFPNVFIASRRIAVYWGKFSVLEPELVCMQDLWKYPSWKYFINLTGQEFPLKTNFEIVKILEAFRGASDVVTLFKCADPNRWRRTSIPHNLRASKGTVHIAASRVFVDYILHNQTAKDILEWTRKTRVPDETFFAVLNSNPKLGIKGTYTGVQDSCDQRYSATRYKMWSGSPCAGRWVHHVCILGIGDLPRLVESTYMFANKFFLKEDRTVIGCLEEKIFNNTRDEYKGVKKFDNSFYSTLDFVINQIT